jgi:hypothetical protein
MLTLRNVVVAVQRIPRRISKCISRLCSLYHFLEQCVNNECVQTNIFFDLIFLERSLRNVQVQRIRNASLVSVFSIVLFHFLERFCEHVWTNIFFAVPVMLDVVEQPWGKKNVHLLKPWLQTVTIIAFESLVFSTRDHNYVTASKRLILDYCIL